MRAVRHIFVGALVAAFALPVVTLVLHSVAGIWRFPAVLPETTTLRAFRYVESQHRAILAGLAGSTAYSLATVACTFVVAVMPAQLIARWSYPGQSVVEALLLAPALVPSITFSMGVHYIFIRLGTADSFAGVVFVLTVFTYPYMLRALIAGFSAYGPEYATCAANLGAGHIRRLITVDIPLLLPALVAGGTVVFLVAFSEYFLVFLIGGGAVASYTTYMFPFLNSADRSVASLLVLLFLSVPLLLFVVIDSTIGRMHRKMGM